MTGRATADGGAGSGAGNGSVLPPAALLDKAGQVWRLEAYVVAIAFNRAGTAGAIALGDGTVRLFDPREGGGADPAAIAVATPAATLAAVPVHDGACLALCADGDGTGFLSGGDDGRLVRVAPDGGTAELFAAGGRWIDQVAASPASGWRACAAGRRVQIFDPSGATPGTVIELPSAVGGLAFDPKGKRLAAAHYGGVTLSWPGRRGWQSKLLAWQGSHLGVTWSPDARFVVSIMQENALHGWRLSDGADMAMSGYPAKVRSLSWTADGRTLCTGGADRVVCWPFRGPGGPMGKQPVQLGPGTEVPVTAVACHPRQEVVASGDRNGLVLLSGFRREHSAVVKAPGEGAVSALAWSPDGSLLALGTEAGCAAILRLPG